MIEGMPKPDYERDGIALYCGDCRDVMAAMPDGYVDAVVTDPPYGVNIAEWDSEMPPQPVLDECLRAASGTVMWFAAAKMLYQLADYQPRPDRTLVWAPSFTLAKSSKGWCFYRYHPIAVWRHPKSQRGIGSDVLRHKCDGRNWWFHPGTKPLDLMSDCVQFASKGGVVLDPFAGSGTTGVACVKLGRSFVGVEKSREYFDIACRRVDEAFDEAALFEGVAS